MIAFEPYRDGDIERLNVQASQAADLAYPHWFEHVVASGPVWKMTAPDGDLLFVGGFWVHHDRAPRGGHATIWCLLAENKRQYMVEITRICRRMITAVKWARVDMVVDNGRRDTLRWARMLGMVFDGPMPGFETHDIFIYPKESGNG